MEMRRAGLATLCNSGFQIIVEFGCKLRFIIERHEESTLLLRAHKRGFGLAAPAILVTQVGSTGTQFGGEAGCCSWGVA